MRLLRRRLQELLAFEHVSNSERLISALGGFGALFAIIAISRALLDDQSAAAVIASMGASAVLVFAVPHGQLSQPWAVFGGHAVAAVIGVACAIWIPAPFLAAPLAVGLSIAAMHYLRCMHPPGGATALTAVIGGEAVQAMGFQFVLTPVLLNVAVLIACGIAFNAPFPWRRYPARLTPAPALSEGPEGLSHTDLEWALRQMDSYIDVSEDDLQRLFALAQHHARAAAMEPEHLLLGGCYSNGLFGEKWQVRKIIDAQGGASAGDTVTYRVVAGGNRGASEVCTRETFAQWARYRVARNENSWHRVHDAGRGPTEQAA